MCCVGGFDLGRGLQGCCGLQLVKSLPWKDLRILCVLGCSALLHIVQGTAVESPLGEVNAAQVQPFWGRVLERCCGTSEK